MPSLEDGYYNPLCLIRLRKYIHVSFLEYQKIILLQDFLMTVSLWAYEIPISIVSSDRFKLFILFELF